MNVNDKVELQGDQIEAFLEKAISGEVSEAKKEILEMVEKTAEEIVEAKLKAQGQSEEVEEKDVDELSKKFFKALRANDEKQIVEVQKEFVELEGKSKMLTKAPTSDLNVGTDSAGGYYVPSPILARINLKAEKYGLARRLATVLNMGSMTLDIPRVSTEAELALVNEGANYGSLNYEFANTTLTAKKYGGILTVSDELMQDSAIDMVDYFSTIFGRAQAKSEDSVFFSAILADTNATTLSLGTGDTSFTSVNFDDLLDMTSQVEEAAHEGAAYIMHQSILNHLRKIKVNTSSDNRYVFGAPGDDGRETIFGFPFYTNGKMPGLAASAANTAFMIFGNLENYALGDRQQASMRVLTERYAEAGKVGIRYHSRFGVGGIFPSDLVVLKTAAV